MQYDPQRRRPRLLRVARASAYPVILTLWALTIVAIFRTANNPANYPARLPMAVAPAAPSKAVAVPHPPAVAPPPSLGGRLNVGVFYDPSDMRQERAVVRIKADAALPAKLAGLNAEWYLDDMATAHRVGVDRFFGKLTPPVLVVQVADRPGVVFAYPAPADADGVVAAVKSIRGVK